MSIWHPGSGITYGKHQQANSYVKDITGQIKNTGTDVSRVISNETKQIVAGQQDLIKSFGSNFSTLNNTVEIGFSKINEELQEADLSIESLKADFNYSMGMLIAEVQLTNDILVSLLDMMDQIYQTLQSPILTQARELYRIGCDRLSRKLLDKALEAFLEAEKKNDTDFFIQYQIGNLYLYGIDEDDNVIDLEKAHEHLLLATRYATSEILKNEDFAPYAADALLKASFAIYFQLGDEKFKKNSASKIQALKEAKKLALRSINIYPNISESYYHVSKYAALLGESEESIRYLSKSIDFDRNYAIKVELDGAFDSVRSNLKRFFKALREKKKAELEKSLKSAQKELLVTKQWKPELFDEYSDHYEMLKNKVKEMSHELNKEHTFFRYLDLLPQIWDVELEITKIRFQISSLLTINVNNNLEKAQNRIIHENESGEALNIYSSAKALINKSKNLVQIDNYESKINALKISEQSLQIIEEGREIAIKAYNLKLEEKKEMRLKFESRERRKKKSSKYANNLAGIGFWIGTISGCVSCVGNNNILYFFGGMISMSIIGAILGYLLGQISE